MQWWCCCWFWQSCTCGKGKENPALPKCWKMELFI
jgi:hypothetical protein